jgi:ornithine cyclodeaminase/alanine dehydrogenase-like protein (mu-crystallin family)
VKAHRRERLEILFLSGDDVSLLGISDDDVLTAVESALASQGRGEVTLDPRVQHVPDPGFPGHFNVLRATVWPAGLTGVKVVGDFARNYEHGLPSELALVTLYEPRTGVPLAIVDGTGITERRTGGVTAVGARHLGRPGSRVLAHVGARGTAFSNVTMLDHLFDFDEIRVTSRRESSRTGFASRLEQALGKPVRSTDTVREAVEGADVVVEATRLTAPEPILCTEWLESCTLLVPYGTMSALELDVLDLFDKVIVDDWSQCVQDDGFGALRPHIRSGLLTAETLYGELAEVVVGRKPGREHDSERILFWHRGLATTDVTLAAMIYRRALEAGVGTRIVYR